MTQKSTSVSCPKCEHQFDVSEVMQQQLNQQVSQAVADQKKRMEDQYAIREQKLTDLQAELSKKEQQVDQLVQQKMLEQEKEFKAKLLEQLKEESAQQMGYLQEELEKKKVEIKKMKELEIQVKRLEADKEDLEHKYRLEYEEKRLTDRKLIEEKLKEEIDKDHKLKLQEKDLQLESLKKRVDEMKKKMEQGSVQIQGEAQEILIENTLKDMFPIDEIKEVPKGKNGADAIQIVRGALMNEAGKILYESKRTKNFNKEWISKIKEDQMREGALISILVTETLPDGVQKMERVDGVWVCDFNTLPVLAKAMRELIVQVDMATESQANKGEKMAMLYDYLCGQEFKMKVEAIITGFKEIKENTTKQRLAMERYWKSNEKIAERVMLNTTHMYGAIKGIAGAAIPDVKMLELPDDEE